MQFLNWSCNLSTSSLECVFETLANVTLFGEMPFRVGLLLEGTCSTPMPEFFCYHPLGTAAASPVGSETADRGGWWHQGPGPAPGFIPEGSRQWEVARLGLSSPPGLSYLCFGEYPAVFRAVGKQGVLQSPCLRKKPTACAMLGSTSSRTGSGLLRSGAEEQGTALAAEEPVQF